MTGLSSQRLKLSLRTQFTLIGAVALVIIVGMVINAYGVCGRDLGAKATEITRPGREDGIFRPTAQQWETFEINPVTSRVFHAELITEGKITVNEDLATPVFSPYAGRVTKLFAKAGEQVSAGQPLFFIEATDMVQAQNDFLTASAGLSKARSKLTISDTIEKQNRRLYDVKAASARDWQQAQADLAQAQSDLEAAKALLEAMRNRLRILGKTDEEIDRFQRDGTITPETPIYAPISGTVVQRKIGPGQYVSYTSTGSVDPVYLIGDLSTVWMVAYIRETQAGRVRVGQALDFKVLAYPDRTYRGNISYVSAVMDPNVRRLMVRAAIPNDDQLLKPEMFARVRILTDEGDAYPAVPRQSIIHEGDASRVLVVRDDRSVEARPIKTGLVDGEFVQVLQGLGVGERIVSKGGLFIERMAAGS